MEELFPPKSPRVHQAVESLKTSGLPGIELPTRSSHLLQAVESLKAAGLSGIGDVMQTTNLEYLDAPSFADDDDLADDDEGSESINSSEASFMLETEMGSAGDNKGRRNSIVSSNRRNSSQGISIHLFPDNVSRLSGLGCSTNTGTISKIDTADMITALDRFDVETVESVVTTTTIKSLIKPSPAIDSPFTLEACTNQCSEGKDLWAGGRCKAALVEFRKALLGLESILGTNHLLVSKLYQWMGQIYLRLLDDDDNDRQNRKQQKDSAIRRRAWADAAVEALTWCLKIRYNSRSDSTSDQSSSANPLGEGSSVDAETEATLARAWKLQSEEWSSPQILERKSLTLIWDSIRIERKVDLALFRMEKNQILQAIDVAASLVNRYNKAISACSDDGAFSAMTKMAFWYHRLGRIKSMMNDKVNDNGDGLILPSSNSSMPLDQTMHFTQIDDSNDTKKITRSRAYLEHAAFCYRMALEAFCTSIGRFDKTKDQYLKDENIDVTTHPTYRQLIVRLEQVLSDHNNSEEKKDNDEISYLRSMDVLDSIFHHFGAKQAMRQYRRLGTNRSESLSRLQALRRSLARAQDGFRAAADIEESAWGADHQIVVRMRQDLRRANGLCDSVDEEILEFPAKQAERQKEQEQEQLAKQKEKELEKRNQQEQEKQAQEQLEKQKEKELEKQNQQEKETQDQLVKERQEEQEKEEKQKRQEREKQKQEAYQKQQKQKQKQQRKHKNHLSSNGIETLRRLQDQVYESQKLLRAQNVERNRLRADLRLNKDEIRKARVSMARKEEEAMKLKRHCEIARSERESLQSQIKQLQNHVNLSEQKYEEGIDLLQSSTEKDNELFYWKEKFKAAENELTERQSSFQEELQKARVDSGSKEAELLVKRLKEENERLRKEMASDLRDRKELEDQQVFDAMTKLAQSDSDLAALKRKFEISQKEWLAINGKADEETQMAIADATKATAELARWKKKFAIAQREWMECQTKAENQARGAIATAKQYEASYSKIAEKFSAAQDGLRSLISEGKNLRKQVIDSQAKRDQLEFSLKKQAIDFGKYQDTLNQKMVEAQVWKDQCQASQQAQKQFSHEMQLSRATDSNLQDRIVVLLERNKELQADQERMKLEVEAKNKEVTSVKEAALKRIRQLKKEHQYQQQKTRIKEKTKEREINSRSTKAEDKDATMGSTFTEYENNIDLSDPSSLATKLGRTQRALEFVEKDHKESLIQIESLTKAKEEMKENIADAQHIISLLKTANNERIEQCSRLETEKDEMQRKVEQSLGESSESKTQIELNDLKICLERSTADKNTLTAELKALKLRLGDIGELHDEENNKKLNSQISTLKSDVQDSDNQNDGNNPLQLDNENPEAQGKISTLLDRCRELEEELMISNQKIEDLQQQVHDTERDIPVDKQNGNDQTHRRTSSSQSIRQQQEDHQSVLVQDFERKLKESVEVRENLSLELKICNEKIASANRKEKEYQRDHDVTNQKIKSLQNQVRDHMKETLAINKEQGDHHLVLVQDLERELEESNEARLNISSELDSCKEKILTLEKNKIESKRLSDKCSKLEDELKDAKQSREEVSSELNTLKKRFEEKEDEFDFLNNEDEFGFLQDKLSKLERELEESSKEKDKLQRQIIDLTSSVENEDEQRQYFVEKNSKLEEELAKSVSEIKSLEAECNKLDKLSNDIRAMEKEKEELMKKYDILEKQYQETKKQAEQNSKSLSTMLEMESKEQDRMRKEYSKLEKDLQEMSKENLILESRVEGMKKHNIDDLSDSSVSCKQCHVLGDELRSTIEQNEKHIEATEKFHDDHENLINRNNFLEKELQETIKQHESLEVKLPARENSAPVDNSENDDKYQDLNIRCIVLEEELRDANELNDKKAFQLEAMERKLVDLEDYADSTAADLERALVVKTAGSEGEEEVRLLIERCSKLQYQLKQALKENERLSNDQGNSKGGTDERKEEPSEPSVKQGNDNNNEEAQSGPSADEQAIQELTSKLVEVIEAKEELEMLMKEAKEGSEHQKRLKGHVEKDRDYLDKMYNECKMDMAEVKSDLEATKELLKKSNDEKEELERQLQIERHVSQSLKSNKSHMEMDNSEENELEELYRQARDELSEVENMLFETEEELDALKAKYQELEKTSKLSASERAESELSGEIVHDLQDLSRDDLMVETRKALRNLQDTQTKVVDLQETNMILQAQLKSSLTFKEKNNKTSARRKSGNGGFWSLGGGDGGRKSNVRRNSKDGNVAEKDETKVVGSEDNPNKGNGNKRFWGWGAGGKGGDANNETNGGDTIGDQ